MKDITKEQKQSVLLEAIRFPLIYIVLVIHVLPPNLKPLDFTFSDKSVYLFISEMISHNYGRIAVPCFFIISGYFFFLKMQVWSRDFYSQQLKKRIKTLLVPYVLWNFLMMLMTLAVFYTFQALEVQHNNTLSLFRDYSIIELLWMPINFPLWYVRDLMCMVVCTPLFYLLFKYLRSWGLLFLTIAYLTTWETDIPGFSMTAIYYFGVGAYWGICKKNIVDTLSPFKRWSYTLTPILLLIATYYNGVEPEHEYWIRPFIIVGVCSFFLLMNSLIENELIRKWCLKLSPTVFFVYAIHEFYIKNWLKGAFSRTPLADSGWGMMIGYILIPFAALIICLILYILWKKISPKTLAILLGNR